MHPKNGNTVVKRIRNELIGVVALAFVVAALFYFENLVVSQGALSPFYDNLFLFGIININIIFIILLVFLIIRNVVKFLYEKKSDMMGSKLRSKLVSAFFFVSLTPALLLFGFSTNFLSGSVDNWFGYMLERPLNEAATLITAHQQQMCRASGTEAALLSDSITAHSLFGEGYRETLKGMFNKRIVSQDLAVISLYLNETEILRVVNPSLPEGKYPTLNKTMLASLSEGKSVRYVERTEVGLLARAAVPLGAFSGSNRVIGAVVVDSLVDPALVVIMDSLLSSQKTQTEVLKLKNPVKIAYVVMLLSVTLGTVFLAIWFGLMTARKITDPISELANATKSVASGNLDYRIEGRSDDEIGVLVDAFNQMTSTIKKSTGELKAATARIEERRKYIETVLEHASTGVIAIDGNGVINTINSAAQKILSTTAENVVARQCYEVVPAEYHHLLEETLQELEESSRDFITTHSHLFLREKQVELSATITKVFDDSGKRNGVVVVFDDMTRLRQAERAAAWREVAKKMAHEVKNPLTPIQLSAQRLQKRFGARVGSPEEAQIFEECTSTIVEQVSVLKKLVNAFSEYAKLPATEVMPHNINDIIGRPVNLFRGAHKDVKFVFTRDDSIPCINVDAEKINRVMVNLLDNAVASLDGKDGGEIVIVTENNEASNSLRVEVRDNGCGIAPQDRDRIFEPYFSTKTAGTGLGLAIVSSIVSDHGGSVGMQDNPGGGTVAFFEIPLPSAIRNG